MDLDQRRSWAVLHGRKPDTSEYHSLFWAEIFFPSQVRMSKAPFEAGRVLTPPSSLRKWKMQTKEWNFGKNVHKNDMAFLVAKAEKTAQDSNKDTIFYSRGKEIGSEKIASFQKRRVAESIAAASPSAGKSSSFRKVQVSKAYISSHANGHHLRNAKMWQ